MRRRSWLVAALFLFAAAAFFMSRGDAPQKEQLELEFPRSLRPAEYERMEKRRTLAAAAPSLEPSPEEQRRGPILDPVLAALPALPGRSALVVEANALRHSPLGTLLVDCLLRGDGAARLDQIRDELGFDPLEDIDRVAVGGEDVLLVTGHFGGARFDRMEPGLVFAPYGEKGRFLEREEGPAGEALAVWGDEMVLLANDRLALEQAIDRLEGRAQATPAIEESSTYGEIYGVIAAAQLAELLPAGQQGLRDLLVEAAERIELHVDASGDVALVVEVQGQQAGPVQDLGKSLGAALSLGRLKARADGLDELVSLLDHARVQPRDGSFALEMALPLALLEEHLNKACRQDDAQEMAPVALPDSMD